MSAKPSHSMTGPNTSACHEALSPQHHLNSFFPSSSSSSFYQSSQPQTRQSPAICREKHAWRSLGRWLLPASGGEGTMMPMINAGRAASAAKCFNTGRSQRRRSRSSSSTGTTLVLAVCDLSTLLLSPQAVSWMLSRAPAYPSTAGSCPPP